MREEDLEFRIGRLELRGGETLVISCERALSQDTVARLSQMLAAKFPGCSTMILSDDLKLSVVAHAAWMPISTVPRDGTPVLVLLDKPHLSSRVHSATFHPNITCIGGAFEFDLEGKATHWMPQPEAPK